METPVVHLLFASKLPFSPTQATADMLTRRELPERASRQAVNNVLIEIVMPEKVWIGGGLVA